MVAPHIICSIARFASGQSGPPKLVRDSHGHQPRLSSLVLPTGPRRALWNFPIIYYLGCGASSFITHTLSAVPSRPYSAPAVLTHPWPSLHAPDRHYPPPALMTHPRPSPVVPLTFVNTCPAAFVNTCRLFPLPPSSPTPYRLLILPVVPRAIPAVLPSPLLST